LGDTGSVAGSPENLADGGTVDGVVDPRLLVRFARVVLTLAAVVLAAVPLIVLLDLADGGTGYGLCPGGVTTCRNPYTAAPELSLVLTLGLFVVVAGFRVTTIAQRRLSRRRVHPGEES
jgi:hypothetical protein